MNALEQELKSLVEKRASLQAKITAFSAKVANAERSLEDANERLLELTAAIDPLEGLIDQISESRPANNAQRESAKSSVEAAEREHDEQLARLEKQLEKPIRDELDKARSAVDREIEDLRKKVGELTAEIAVTESAVSQAQDRLALKEVTFSETLERYSGLAGVILTAIDEVTNAGQLSTASLNAGDSAEAFVLTRDFGDRLELLRGLTDSKKEQELVDCVIDARREVMEAREVIQVKTSDLGRLNNELLADETELQKAVESRESRIQDLVRAAPATKASKNSTNNE